MKFGQQSFEHAQRFLAVAGVILTLFALCMTLAYPKSLYSDAIGDACTEFSVNPSLVRAVIVCESSFRPDAVSPVGAVGLMQLMPLTARFCAESIGMCDYRDEQLADPSTNIRLGTYYLSYLLSRFDCERDAIAAYNAGEGNVRNWLALGLTDIPFPETKTYLSRVLFAKARYEAALRLA